MLELKKIEISCCGQSLFQPVDIRVLPGQIVTIMGPSGCGKSTLLAGICGSLAESFTLSGQIVLNRQEIQDFPIEKRGVGILFQDDLLFPHMNVEENLLFGLPQKNGCDRKHREELVGEVLCRAELEGFQKRRVETLSGGQRARISLLRTLLSCPHAVLFDEPFSKLDRELRTNFRNFVRDRIVEMKIPAIVVSHDVDDVLDGEPYYLQPAQGMAVRG